MALYKLDHHRHHHYYYLNCAGDVTAHWLYTCSIFNVATAVLVIVDSLLENRNKTIRAIVAERVFCLCGIFRKVVTAGKSDF